MVDVMIFERFSAKMFEFYDAMLPIALIAKTYQSGMHNLILYLYREGDVNVIRKILEAMFDITIEEGTFLETIDNLMEIVSLFEVGD